MFINSNFVIIYSIYLLTLVYIVVKHLEKDMKILEGVVDKVQVYSNQRDWILPEDIFKIY